MNSSENPNLNGLHFPRDKKTQQTAPDTSWDLNTFFVSTKQNNTVRLLFLHCNLKKIKINKAGRWKDWPCRDLNVHH